MKLVEAECNPYEAVCTFCGGALWSEDELSWANASSGQPLSCKAEDGDVYHDSCYLIQFAPKETKATEQTSHYGFIVGLSFEPVCAKPIVVYAARCPSRRRVHTAKGDVIVEEGDYIVLGVKGKYYKVKSDTFWATYERV